MHTVHLKLLSDYSPFHWITTRHSTAAGLAIYTIKGYSRVIVLSAKDAFEAVGIKFSTHKFRMGGQSLGPEVCFCMREVFEGEDEIDIDVLSWDFGMKDHLQHCWGSRAFWFSSRPVKKS